MKDDEIDNAVELFKMQLDTIQKTVDTRMKDMQNTLETLWKEIKETRTVLSDKLDSELHQIQNKYVEHTVKIAKLEDGHKDLNFRHKELKKDFDEYRKGDQRTDEEKRKEKKANIKYTITCIFAFLALVWSIIQPYIIK